MLSLAPLRGAFFDNVLVRGFALLTPGYISSAPLGRNESSSRQMKLLLHSAPEARQTVAPGERGEPGVIRRKEIARPGAA